jgi:hypothetical protein
MQIEIPSDILEIMHKTQYVHDEYCEFSIDITVNDKREVVFRDLLGVWDRRESYGSELTPEQAYTIIRKWWANEQENLIAQQEKAKIQEEIVALQSKLDGLEKKAKKNKWLWW